MKLKDLISFLLGRKLLLSVGIILAIELLFQFGIYRSFLKKNSYAANINRGMDHVIKSRKVLDPNLLLLGTSIAFEGLSVRILNEELEPTGLKLQSLAVRASEIVVQYQLLDTYLKEFPKVHTIIHVMEPNIAWVDSTKMEDPTLAMLSELGNFRAIPLVRDFEYDVKPKDYFFLLLKSIAYRKDLADFFINFNERIKAIARNQKFPNPHPWDYENKNTESMGSYHINNLESCFKIIHPESSDPIPEGSNIDHRRMIFETCIILRTLPHEPVETENTRRYFRKLKKMYSLIGKKKIHIVNVFAPYSFVIRAVNTKERMQIWTKGLTSALGDYQPLDQIDFQDSLGIGDNGEYCYDLVHLNKKGMERFSKILGDELRRRFEIK